MDLRLSDDELAFRDEVRGFIRDHLPEDIRDRLRLGHSVTKSDIVRWQRILILILNIAIVIYLIIQLRAHRGDAENAFTPAAPSRAGS